MAKTNDVNSNVIDIAQEVYSLRNDLTTAINNNKLPIVVKLMIANELVDALKKAEVEELRNLKVKEIIEAAKSKEEKEG